MGIAASDDTDVNPRPGPRKGRLIGLRDSKGQIGWLEVCDVQSGYGMAFDYEGTLGKHFHMKIHSMVALVKGHLGPSQTNRIQIGDT